MKRWIIVNKANNVPIRRIGFCNSYATADEANRACASWNKLANGYEAPIGKVVVREY